MKRIINALIFLLLLSQLTLGQDPRKPPPDPTNPEPKSGVIGFGGKEKVEWLANPYRFSAPLALVAQAIKQVIKDEKLVLDEEKSQSRNGLFVTKPHVFTRGMAFAKTDLLHVADLPAEETRSWISGRYSLEIQMSPVDARGTHVTVIALIEGQAQGMQSNHWFKSASKGVLENDFLLALRQYIELR